MRGLLPGPRGGLVGADSRGPCFWVWLTSLNTMSSRSVHTLVSERGKLSDSPACRYATFLLTFYQGSLGSFRFSGHCG